MEENKKNGQAPEPRKKLSYEELNQMAGDLHLSNQKLYARVQELQDLLSRRDFEYTSFLLSSLFRVVDHLELYDDKFGEWAVQNIQDALTSLVESTKPKEETDGKAE